MRASGSRTIEKEFPLYSKWQREARARPAERSAASPVGKVEIVGIENMCMRTARLDLVAATIDHLAAELENPQRLPT